MTSDVSSVSPSPVKFRLGVPKTVDPELNKLAVQVHRNALERMNRILSTGGNISRHDEEVLTALANVAKSTGITIHYLA